MWKLEIQTTKRRCSRMNFNSMRSVVITRLEMSSRHKRFMIDKDSDGNLMPFSIFKILFPHTAVDQLNQNRGSSVMFGTMHKQTFLSWVYVRYRSSIKINKYDNQVLCSSRKWNSFIRYARHGTAKYTKCHV